VVMMVCLTGCFVIQWHCCIVATRDLLIGVVVVIIAFEWSSGCFGVVRCELGPQSNPPVSIVHSCLHILV
jgi:hypothetical protein